PAPIDALIAGLAGEGLAALPVFVASLKERQSERLLDEAFAAAAPAIVLNTTAFAVSRLGAERARTVLDRPGRPVLQVVLAGSSEEAWRDSARGLGPHDLTMNVVLPEVDGRVLTRAISFKADLPLGESAHGRARTYLPVADRVGFVARQAAAWVRLAETPAARRRVAIVLSNYPDRDGRIGNGVGLDTPESTIRLVKAMAGAGYGVGGIPETGAALMEMLLAGQTNALPTAKGATPNLPLEGRSKSASAGDADFGRGFATSAAEFPPPEFAVAFGSANSTSPQGGGWAPHSELSLSAYLAFFNGLPGPVRAALTERWGAPEDDPFFANGGFRLAVHRFGNLAIGIQPARGYGIDPKATYHDPGLVPPHHYLAFYLWLRKTFMADAIVHMGKHGNLEWLPGKALGLSEGCWPEVALDATPVVYPFIVNDPGEGSQAKRRSSAVVVDHLMPPMTRAEIHGGLAELETLIDEYTLAAAADRRRRDYLANEILATAERFGLDRDLGLTPGDGGAALVALDAHLCELKEMQIRDGLHILGSSPTGQQRADTLVAIARVPRPGGRPADGSLQRAIADDLGLGFDPLDCDLAADWSGPRPAALADLSAALWRSHGDTVERIEALAGEFVACHASHVVMPGLDPGIHANIVGAEERWMAGTSPAMTMGFPGCGEGASDANSRPPLKRLGALHAMPRSRAVLSWIAAELAPALDACGGGEIAAVLTALDGRFVAPGPSGAPTRGRPDVLPTGRNFYSVDVRAVPTAAAWALGKQAAEALALRYFQDTGVWPRSIAMSAWATSNMRTGGDDIAQVLALIGAEPVWEAASGRVTGFRVVRLADLNRPRIDVTLRISGMFRDAFPGQIDLIDSAVRAVAGLDEDDAANPIAAAARQAERALAAAGLAAGAAARLAATRVFGAKPGAYGAGLQVPIDEGIWESRADLAKAFLAWGGFAYGGGSAGEAAGGHFTQRLAATDAVFQAQDNREHDILDSDDYYQFMGGLAATVETLKGVAPRIYHGDHARPEKPVVR
ncbi:MAG: cobaltochelatase subunit CobN, partial [Bauldia sp.]